MEIELKEIRDFMAGIPPFDRLPLSIVEELTENTTIRYLRRGSDFPPQDVNDTYLYLVRTGAISHYSEENSLLEKLAEADFYSRLCTDSNKQADTFQVDEDSLIYTIPCNKLTQICQDHPQVLAFFKESASQRLNQAVTTISSDRQQQATLQSSLMVTKVGDILHANVVSVPSGSSIRQAAQKMSENNLSSLLILSQDQTLQGIITDKDFRKRCIAAGVSTDEPVNIIMSIDILTIPSDMLAFDALMLMTRKHIHHLPICDDDELKGIINITDLMRSEGKNSVYLGSAIRRADSIELMAEHSAQIPNLQSQLVKMGATADHVGNSVSAITTAITLRLIEMAEQKLGPAPVPYAWVAAGSQARREQTSHSDQDNGLIISNQMEPEDEQWFADLATFVCDGLNACGFIYCPGNVMATNPKWRQTQDVWQGYFDQWVDKPEPKALMYSSIFFDLRTIHGDKKLLRKIRKKVLKKTQKNTLFLGLLVQNALKLRPPLGFFRDFVLINDGEHNDTLDLKHNGIVPIVDLARIYALAEGIAAVNTTERLKKAAGTQSLSKEGSANLLDAFEFLATLRIQHQSKQIDSGKTADNFMAPADISRLEREHMKDAFKVIQTMQSSLKMRF
jgi:CBS domain-containing protein